MKLSIWAVLALAFASIVLISPAQADGFKEGKWDLTMVTKMGGAEGAKMDKAMAQIQNLPPQVQAMMQQRGIQMNGNPGGGITIKVTQCLTSQNPVPKHTHNNENCQETHQMNGNTVTFHANCSGNGTQMVSDGTMTYSGDSVQGQIKSHGTTSSGPMDSTIDISGQYQGPCEK